MAQLNKVDNELTAAREKRASLAPEPIVLPADLPALYRAYVEDLAETLSDEDVSGRASEELHTVIDTVVVEWDAEAKIHTLELRGNLLELLSVSDKKKAAGLASAAGSLKLVAGVGFEPTTFRL